MMGDKNVSKMEHVVTNVSKMEHVLVISESVNTRISFEMISELGLQRFCCAKM